MWRHRIHSMFYCSNWHPNPLNQGFVHLDFKSPFDVGVRNGPQSYRLQWQGQVKSVMLPRVVYQPLLHMIFENNQALGGPGLLEKEPAKCWNQGAFSWLNSCGLTRCLAAGFSLFIACFQYVVTGACVRRWCLAVRFGHVCGGWVLGLPQKNCCPGNYPRPEECSHQFFSPAHSGTATALGSRLQCGRLTSSPLPEAQRLVTHTSYELPCCIPLFCHIFVTWNSPYLTFSKVPCFLPETLTAIAHKLYAWSLNAC